MDRLNGGQGFCGVSSEVLIASAVLHRGEEPPLLGADGSGAVFFSGCSLGCGFCQNIQISCDLMGSVLSVDELADLFIRMQAAGAANINLVTAAQFAPSAAAAAADARNNGLVIPVMWNSSGYENVSTVNMLKETIDIWLPDIKTLDTAVADRLFGAPDYPKAAAGSIKEMAAQVKSRGGILIEDHVMKRGIIVRHLVMPGELASTRRVLEWYSENLKDTAMLSVMVQYTPVNDAGRIIAGSDYIMSDHDYEQILSWLEDYGIEEGFLQEPEAASSEWIPDFSRQNPFPDKYSRPVWHWKAGYIN